MAHNVVETNTRPVKKIPLDFQQFLIAQNASNNKHLNITKKPITASGLQCASANQCLLRYRAEIR